MNELAEILESELEKLNLKQDNDSDTFILVNNIFREDECEKDNLKISFSDNSLELSIAQKIWVLRKQTAINYKKQFINSIY